jgi:hypothetical protein
MFSVDLSTRGCARGRGSWQRRTLPAGGRANAAGPQDALAVMDGLVCQSATRNAVVRDPAAVAPLAGCADDR